MSPLSKSVALGCSCVAFIIRSWFAGPFFFYREKVLSFVFLMAKCVEFCAVLFLHQLRWSVFIFFILFMRVPHWLSNVEPSCPPGMSYAWLQNVVPLICGWTQFAGILLKVFACVLGRGIGFQFSFLVAVSLFDFWLRVTLPSEWVRDVFFCSLFRKNSRRIGISFLSNLRIHQGSALILSFLCWEIFDYWLFIVGLFEFSFSCASFWSCVSLAGFP